MTKKFIYVFFLLFGGRINFTHSQIGVKFAPDSSRWSTEFFYYININTTVHGFNNLQIKGDTIINGKYCQKLYGNSSQYFDTTCLQYNSYIHYNNRKLYADTLLINDFNLNAGDTFNLYVSDFCMNHNGYYKFPVDYTDSIYYGNKWRKRIVFKQISGFNFGCPIRWVEGMGDIDHGLAVGGINFYGFVEQATCTGFARLNCFQEQGLSAYGMYCYNGPCTTGLNEINNESNISIYPNPSAGIFIIESPKHISSIEISNFIGEKIYSSFLCSNKLEIDLSQKPQGIYFIKANSGLGIVIKKIIIQ